VLVAIPIFGRTADQLHDQLTKAVGTSKTAAGLTTSIGAVNLLLSNPVSTGVIRRNGSATATFSLPLSWLLVGTVTAATLERAGTDLIAAAR
jgi:hypothetical protein